MQNKQFTSTALVAGTCIGGGTIALPIVLAKFGIIPSIITIVATWLLIYYTSLVGTELNLQSEIGLSHGELGKKFSGKGAQFIGEFCVKLLSYAVLVVYLSGASSILQKLTKEYFEMSISMVTVETGMAIFCAIILAFPTKIVSVVNNVSIMGLVVLLFTLLCAMFALIDYTKIPWMVSHELTMNDMLIVITVIFASYGYHLILHNIREYCGKDHKTLRKSILYGSLIATTVYIVWAGTSLSVIFRSNPNFFYKIVNGSVEAGDLVRELAKASGLASFQVLVWWMSVLAIFTSFLGVSLGLFESMDLTLKNKIKEKNNRKMISTVIIVIPVYIVSVFVPNAFVNVLGFAGSILVVIGIFLPIYLFFKAKINTPYFKELKKYPLVFCCVLGAIIMAAEAFLVN